jgi:HSP20 family protein
VPAEHGARTAEGVRWLRREMAAGVFERRVTLGDGLDLDNIAATYNDGILTVAIPILEHRPSRSGSRSAPARCEPE